MSSRLGIELGPQTLRAVRFPALPRGQIRTLEVSWDPGSPAEAVAQLRAHLGTARQVCAAVDLSLLHVKRIALPPVALQEKRRILALEPERFFAVRGAELVFAFQEQGDLVFAAREMLADAWIHALRELGPLVRLEPTPFSLARVMAKADAADGFLMRQGENGVVTSLRLKEGRLESARRLRGDLTSAVAQLKETDLDTPVPIFLEPWSDDRAAALRQSAPQFDPQRLPDVAGLDPAYLAAYGAGLAPEAGWQESLLTVELERTLGLRRRTRLGLSSAACAAALLILILSLDAYRERTEQRLDQQIVELQSGAGEALDLQRRVEALGRQARAVQEAEATRTNPLAGLLALSRQFPEGAWIRSISASADEVQLDGYATDAAALIPLFENDPRFEDVRFLSGTSRTQFADQTYENFSLALRVVRTP